MAQPTALGSNRRGFLLAVLAAASAALFLFLPTSILAYSAYLLAVALSGHPVVGTHVVAETYVLVGGPAVVSVLLMVVPYLLCRAASHRIGHEQSALIIGGLLAIWHAGVAVYWAWSSSEGLSHAPTGDALWYPLGFGLASVIATLLVARWVAVLPTALVLVMGLLLSGLVRVHTAVPPGAQQVEVEVSATEIRLSQDTVQAGDVYLVLVTPRSSITVTENELVEGEVPTDHNFDLTGCTDAQRAEDRGQVGYCGNVFKVTLEARTYVFYSTAANGPGQALARLEVLP